MLSVLQPLLLAFLLQFLASLCFFFKVCSFKKFVSSCVLFIIIASGLWLHMTLVFPYIYLILLYIWLEFYVFSVCTICNSLVDCRKVQIHADFSGGPTSFSTEYCFLLSDVQVQSNNASNVWTWYVDVL